MSNVSDGVRYQADAMNDGTAVFCAVHTPHMRLDAYITHLTLAHWASNKEPWWCWWTAVKAVHVLLKPPAANLSLANVASNVAFGQRPERAYICHYSLLVFAGSLVHSLTFRQPNDQDEPLAPARARVGSIGLL